MKLIVWSLALALTFSCALTARAYAQIKADEFGNNKLLVPHKDSVKPTNVRLRFEADALVIEPGASGELGKRFSYAAIKTAEYSYSKHPRWKEGLGAAAVGTVAVGAGLGVVSFAAMAVLGPIVAVPLFLKTARMKGKKHWLTIKTDNDYAVLQLDKRNYRLVIPALETRTGIKVETVGAEER